jgi:catechol 2,3-dioxygenase
MAIVRVGFLELWVRDLDRSLEFYQGLLGLRLEHREGKSAYLRGYEELEWSLKLTRLPSRRCGPWASRWTRRAWSRA